MKIRLLESELLFAILRTLLKTASFITHFALIFDTQYICQQIMFLLHSANTSL
jgi:hypothetical protein